LSPYCVLHASPDGTTFTLHHGLYGSRFALASDLFPALAALHRGAALDDVLDSLPREAREAVELLVQERVLVDAEANPETFDPAGFRHRLTPVELVVQRGFTEGGYDPATLDPSQAPPSAKHVEGLRVVDLATCERTSALGSFLQRRRSVRDYDDTPLSRHDFEQFLDLSARARPVDASDAEGRWVRSYPSGGGLYPLEIYPVIYRVEGIPPALYHYSPFRHRLAELDCEPEHRDALLAWARRRLGVSRPTGPSVLFLITAVFGRMYWKYSGMAYQTILMETGALYQTMYLAATSLDLAPCAVGAFPERATAELIGADAQDEAQVGMFALGVPARRER
jgi:SagB-type dehydrogenase family enzyme